MKKATLWILLTILLFAQAQVNAQPGRTLPPLPKYTCNFTSERIIVDGHLSDAAWEKAPRTERFGEIRYGEAMPFETYVKMLWDDKGMYFAYYIQQEDIWGTISERDALSFFDNDAEIFIDPDGDGKNYFELEMTALNQIYDIHWNTRLTWGEEALVTPPGIWNIDFDFVGLEHAMQYDGTLNYPDDKDRAWTAELFFPWRSFAEYANMPLPPKEGDSWRVDFYRCEYEDRSKTSGDSYSWSAHGKVNMHVPERFGFVTFVKQ